MTVVTRFAPSPTGYLHVGGARTALFSWLYAKRRKGRFILRIEDTDLERSTPESVDAILEAMAWLALGYDEGPYYQTQRFDRYNAVIDQLLAEGKAYRCDCSKERLEALREQQMANKQKPRYDGCCRERSDVAADGPHVVRFRNPQDGVVAFDDLVRGPIRVQNSELDDLIIRRTDGSPTYNFTVVVDDLDMGVTDVIRGDDHINNTPRQINIMLALGAEAPRFAHVPMILGDDGARLSKRHGAVSVMQYKEEGYLPEALLNYLVRLGWSHGDQEVFSIAEMIELFDVADVNRAPSAFNTEKLLWLNQHYLKACDLTRLAELLIPFLPSAVQSVERGQLQAAIELQRERAQTLVELADLCQFFFQDFPQLDSGAAKKNLKGAALQPLTAVRSALAACEEWQAAHIHGAIEQTVKALEVGFGKVGMPLRTAVTNGAPSPALDRMLEIMGRETTLRRIDKALEFIANMGE